MQTTIDDQAHIFTLINTFKVHEGQAARVTRSAFEAMFESPAAKDHMRELGGFVVSISPVFYDVVYVGKASP